MARKGGSVSKKLRGEIVKLAQQPGASLEWIAADLGISVFLIERWLRAPSMALASQDVNGKPIRLRKPTKNLA